MKKTIQISGLSKSYDGKKVIENLSFSVAAGEVYGLLGANGVGKSTTIECILGTKKADSGTVRILGLDPWTERKQLFKHCVRKRSAFIGIHWHIKSCCTNLVWQIRKTLL